MDSRRRIPTTELPRCVSAGSTETGNLEVFFPGIVNGPERVDVTTDSHLCAPAPRVPLPAPSSFPHENLCLQNVAMLASSQSPCPVNSFFPQPWRLARSQGVSSHPVIMGSFVLGPS